MSARSIFDEVRKSGWDQVLAWPTEKKEESLHLDFKRRAPSATFKLQPADRSVLAKAFSGFANVEGGVLVFGVHATGSSKSLPDHVVAIESVEDLSKFSNEVDRNVKTLTDPPIAGVTVEEVRDPSGDRGILVVYVPQSDGGPHRATGAESDVNERYYMRTGTSTVVMPHSLLADRFGRRPPPKLRIGLSRELRNVNLYVGNIGRGYAESVYLRAELVRPENFSSINGSIEKPFEFVTHIPVPGKPDMALHSAKMTRILYPDEWQKAMTFDLPLLSRVIVNARLDAIGAQPIMFRREVEITSDELTIVEDGDKLFEE